MPCRALLTFTLVAAAATPALAERSLVNLHVDIAVGAALDGRRAPSFVLAFNPKVDIAVAALGAFSPQVEFLGVSALTTGPFRSVSMVTGGGSEPGVGYTFAGGVGGRLRLWNDEKGFLLNPGSTHKGNWWGNAWADAHFIYGAGGQGPGFDVGLGAEFSLVEGLSVGPLFKFVYFGPTQVFLGGLSLTVGAPAGPPEDTDYDEDGVRGKDDKCQDDAEDADGFEDADGCPEPDNDKDGVLDAADKCPTTAEDKDGVADADGCPETDADSDGLLDAADKCPVAAEDKDGLADEDGCPETDVDGDGVLDSEDTCPTVAGDKAAQGCPDADGDGLVDAADRCPKEKGASANGGCPWPDADADGVPDRLDACVNEAGPAPNGGCPEARKQLLLLAEDGVQLQEPLAFDARGALAKASAPVLDQLAALLKARAELQLKVEAKAPRAKAVLDALVKRGVPAARLEAGPSDGEAVLLKLKR